MNDVVETRWWWVRHAVVPNAQSVIYGSEDKPCDTSDWASFDGLAALLPKDAVWVMTDLQRTHQTSKAIRDAGLSGPDSLIEPDFKEQSLGAWHGRTWDEIRDIEKIAFDAFWRLPAYGKPPSGESFADLYGRTTPVIERLNAAHQGRDIIAVTHGGTIRAAVAMALEIGRAHV